MERPTQDHVISLMAPGAPFVDMSTDIAPEVIEAGVKALQHWVDDDGTIRFLRDAVRDVISAARSQEECSRTAGSHDLEP